jgi:Phage-related minor tail protein
MSMSALEVMAVFRVDDQPALTALRRIAEQVKALSADIKEMIGQNDSAFAGMFAAMSRGIDTSIAEVDRLAVAWREVGAAAGTASRAAAGGGGSPRNLLGRGPGGAHFTPSGIPLPGGHLGLGGMGGNLAMAGAGAAAYGIYEEMQIEQAAALAMRAANIPLPGDITQSEYYKKFREIITRNAIKGGFSPHDVAEAMLGSEYQFAGQPFEKRMDILDTLMPFAAQESLQKHTGLKEAAEAFVGIAHMTGTYDPAKLPGLFSKFAYASMLTPSTLPQFQNALSYSMPSLVGGMGMDPDAVMFLTAMNQAAGVKSTKAGTWIQSFFSKLMPDQTGTKKGQAHDEAMREMGLLDANNHPTWMVQGANGKTDWMASIQKLAPILGEKFAAMPEEQRLGKLEQIFGKQGGREAGLMNLPEFIAQFPQLGKQLQASKGGEDFLSALGDASPMQAAKQAMSEMQVLLMNIGQTAIPLVNTELRVLNSVLQGIIGIMNSMPTWLGTALKDSLANAATGGAAGGIKAGKNIWDWFTKPKEPSAPGDDSKPEKHGELEHPGVGKMSFFIPPSPSTTVENHVTTLNIDGAQLARVVEEHIAQRHELADSASTANGVAYTNLNDWNSGIG